MLEVDRGQNEVLFWSVHLYKLQFWGRAAVLAEPLEQRGFFGIRRDACKRGRSAR